MQDTGCKTDANHFGPKMEQGNSPETAETHKPTPIFLLMDTCHAVQHGRISSLAGELF
ncbi:hypothetical protein MPLA_140307 [Mesorhizobium sp. ORS 3359]|nr:hypothetical protein MPLA_140307 [Mesorhizobium sp. ORS 3359]